MKKKSVFEFTSYKSFMNHLLTSKDQRGHLTRAAEAVGCQRSYLSRVISEALHLTPDHAFKLSRYWKLTAEEREYFQTLVEFERAGDPEYRTHLKSRLNEMKRRYESVQERTGRTQHSVAGLERQYFSTWIWSALHFLTSIPAFQTVDAMSNRLGLNSAIVEQHLIELEKMGFIEKKQSRWIYRSGEFHAPKDSPLVILYHQNWRNRAVVDSYEMKDSSVHSTTVQTLSRSDYKKIKEMLLQFLSEASQIAGPSNPEECMALTCDLFKV